MATTTNNIETINVVANAQDGYNADVTNDVVVLNGDTFYKKNIVVGQRYRYGSHYFVIDKFETRGTHLYYIGTVDNKPFANDLHSLKVTCECTERRTINRSANDTEHGKAVKVKRTTKESATQIVVRYNKAIEAINSAVSKLTNSDATADLLHSLIDSLNADCNAFVEAINSAALAEHNQRIEQIAALDAQIAALDAQIDVAYNTKDIAKLGKLSTSHTELEAQRLLLQQAEAAYLATITPASSDNVEATEACANK